MGASLANNSLVVIFVLGGLSYVCPKAALAMNHSLVFVLEDEAEKWARRDHEEKVN